MVLLAILVGVGAYTLVFAGLSHGKNWAHPWQPLIAGFTGQPAA